MLPLENRRRSKPIAPFHVRELLVAQILVDQQLEIPQRFRVRHFIPSGTETICPENPTALFLQTCAYSGRPEGGMTMSNMLSISLCFRILSFAVVDVNDGDAFTYAKV